VVVRAKPTVTTATIRSAVFPGAIRNTLRLRLTLVVIADVPIGTIPTGISTAIRATLLVEAAPHALRLRGKTTTNPTTRIIRVHAGKRILLAYTATIAGNVLTVTRGEGGHHYDVLATPDKGIRRHVKLKVAKATICIERLHIVEGPVTGRNVFEMRSTSSLDIDHTGLACSHSHDLGNLGEIHVLIGTETGMRGVENPVRHRTGHNTVIPVIGVDIIVRNVGLAAVHQAKEKEGNLQRLSPRNLVGRIHIAILPIQSTLAPKVGGCISGLGT
jgi:hypothetical protein